MRLAHFLPNTSFSDLSSTFFKEKLESYQATRISSRLAELIAPASDMALAETRKLSFSLPSDTSLVAVAAVLSARHKTLLFSPVVGIQAKAEGEAEIYYTKKVN